MVKEKLVRKERDLKLFEIRRQIEWEYAFMLVSKSLQHMEDHDTANGRHVLKRKNIRRHIGAVR